MKWKKIIFGANAENKHTVRRTFIRIGLLIITFFVLIIVFVDHFIFLPQNSNMKPDKTMTMIQLPDNQGEIAVKYIDYGRNEFVVLYSHGNAEDLFTIDPERFAPLGSRALFYDYEGYGASTGSPGEMECYRSAEAAYNYLTDTIGIEPGKIIIYGFSVGSGPACYLAEKFPVAALVLEAPFTSAFETLLEWPTFPNDRFRNIDRIDNIKCPILIFHGTADTIIPFSRSERLHAAAPGSKLVPLEMANHTDCTNSDIYWRELKEFIKSLETP